MTNATLIENIDLRAFDCICRNCQYRFEGLDFPDFEYGRRILRTRSGKYLALLDGNEDKVMDEFSSILATVVGPTSSRRIGSLFDKTFGIACDPIFGEAIDASLQQVCPRCGSSLVDTFDIVPKKTALARVYPVQHKLWQMKPLAEKVLAVRCALESTS